MLGGATSIIGSAILSDSSLGKAVPADLGKPEIIAVTPFIGPGLMRVAGCGHVAAPC